MDSAAASRRLLPFEPLVALAVGFTCPMPSLRIRRPLCGMGGHVELDRSLWRIVSALVRTRLSRRRQYTDSETRGLISVASAIVLTFILPEERPIDPKGKLDVFGACLGLSSLLLFNIAWR